MGAINRRQAFLLGGGFVALTVLPMAANAEPSNDAAELIKKFTGGKEAAKGKITLDLPEIAENGNTVPLALTVESPMTAENYVKEVLFVADGNPNAGVATLMFTPMSGKAEASIRIRLAQTQNVIAVAKMSDGSLFTERKTVKVTIGGCGG
ncbi:MAG: thiosulfate oxidation carrier protein SoxY [Bradyrhizobium sp.]|jgi:sulfur-oxidizing protein SoxY|uniref:Thiosulfate oxidation carrier protein SoxY n=1 Tax=Bradyrhizobium denitrificans TaxID=2734912 RepID=A0ABS5GE91_9BRAD|nr:MULTISPECIES: thiosulfate oxidation carrier protein SoxY [Bradyrhizobium]RTL97652.1 MAG: thiosulfate oxidation carrier protein SoxY [Bradyrhizobiaceae bacterium]ABQ35752.1 thiosulfate-binding protein SoxY [Bradyrhizobium sp. BTAi1]MBR1139656.1 thiosulfate oxidation carrier protein SoxY [Bradyrhizobium denitrificans]MCL8484314.1 thiosulfate oxidation carrier protein SoxY [Bradyrhizobium denitrificans]MDU0953652.1 thiosulfate oxidation carrier protein SoxY [Bradyrhizobium sp.]